MNLKKILLSSVAAVALTSVAALAADDNTVNSGAVQVAQDQTGDYLVFPAYYANSAGWETNLKVVNTNTTHAVVAKVVIREYMNSAEKLDFPIYLTPGDVWEGTLKHVNGKVYITSTDDSMFNNGTPASDVNPVNQPLFDAIAGSQDNTKGYVEVFGFAAVAPNSITGITGWTQGNPVDKAKFYAYYNAAQAAGTITNPTWLAVDNDSLYGQEVISQASTDLAMTLMATAFENVTGATPNGQAVVQDSTLTTNTVQNELLLIPEIEAALQKSDVFVTYYESSATTAAETALLLNQPMKKYRYANTTLPLSNVGYAPAGADLTASTLHTFKYTPIARNQTENSLISTNYYSGGTAEVYTCNVEFCQISVNSYTGSYTKGYVDFSLDQDGTSANVYNSMPVIPVVMTAKKVGTRDITNIIYPAFK